MNTRAQHSTDTAVASRRGSDASRRRPRFAGWMALAGLAWAAAAPAQAAGPAPGRYSLAAVHSGECVDVTGDDLSDGTPRPRDRATLPGLYGASNVLTLDEMDGWE